MPDRLAYRLVVSTRCGATHFCIAAADDEEALTKADRIAACLDVGDADVCVTRDMLPVFRPPLAMPPAPGLPATGD